MSGAPNSIKRNILYSMLYTLLNIGFPVLSFAYVARIMGLESLGRLNFATALAGFFVLAASLAMPLYGAREIALVRGDSQKLKAAFSELFLLNGFTTLLSIGAYAALFSISSRMRDDWPLFLVCGAAILANAVSVEWFFQGLENYRFILWRNLAFKIASLGLILTFVRRREDILVVASIGVFANAGSNLLGFLAAARQAPIKWRPWSRIKSHLGPMGILSASTLAASMYVYLDTILLGYLSGNAAVGLFTSATRGIRVAISAVQSLTAVIIPRFSWYMGQGKVGEYRLMARKSLSLIYLFTFPAAGALFALAPRIINVLSGPGFEGAYPTMRIAAPLVVLMGFTNFLGLQIIFPNKGEKKLLFATLLSASLCLALNLALIPRFAQDGTAIALIAAETCSAIVLALLAGKNGLGFGFFDGVMLRYAAMGAVAAGVMHSVSRAIQADFPAILVSGLAGGTVYFLGLFLFRDLMAMEILALARNKFAGLLPGGRT